MGVVRYVTSQLRYVISGLLLTLTLYSPLASLRTLSGLRGALVRSSGRRMSSMAAMQSTKGDAFSCVSE